MRDWNLALGDPLFLGLAADFRLSAPVYTNDHIWELELEGGDPPALALRTTYGLRARTMRIFPRFSQSAQSVVDPAAFLLPPRLRRFTPNFLLLDFAPFPNIDVTGEYWIPDSNTAAGRFTITNCSREPLSLLFELCGQLIPIEGQSLGALSMQLVNVLAGCTADLAPVLFLTGGPRPGPGPYPSLALDLDIPAGGSRTVTWVQAALPTPEASFDLARRTAAREWDAERTRLEMAHTAQTVEVRTGDPDWDAAFALSQKAAFGLFFGPTAHLPHPSFVLARQPDHGYSPRGDGSDYSSLWNGQSLLESWYLASNLPGTPELAQGLLYNFLAAQSEEGHVDWKPGLAGQRGRWLAAPMLATLAWQTYQRTGDIEFLRTIQPALAAFCRCWFQEAHDRDRDGFPEWDHPFQTGLEDQPAFTLWHPAGQGADISTAESPALAALLCRELQCQAYIADALGQPAEREALELQAGSLRALAEECWQSDAVLYHLRDRDSHASPRGRHIGQLRGPGVLELHQAFEQPLRLLVQFQFEGETVRSPEVRLHGRKGLSPQEERFERMDLQWGPGRATATSRLLYTNLVSLEVTGVEPEDQVSVAVMDFSCEDLSLFLPLWAGIPNLRRARTLVSRTLFAAQRFGRPFGIPVSPYVSTQDESGLQQAVHLPWNALIGEGLLAYGLREEAAQLTVRLMSAVIENLKKRQAFYRAYHAETGIGLGERNTVQGLAPLGLFLAVLGVEIHSPKKVLLRGKNPFPWPVVVQYRGLSVTRQAEQTVIVFPNGQTITVKDPTHAVVSVD